MTNDDLIINDPIYGFINIPSGLLRNIVDHRFFQRMGRISQLGLLSWVYPGAHHTRKEHSLGAFHLLQKSFRSLANKGVYIFDVEEEAALAAILLHDVGHGPFSHLLENILLENTSHEEVSIALMNVMNEEMGGCLENAINIYQGNQSRPFLHSLVSSQLDVDRLDYIERDSFYTGVHEGHIGTERIISMLDVINDTLVVKSKGIYTLENYLMVRRLMYWQVYLHKASISAMNLLQSLIKRARFVVNNGDLLFGTPSLLFILQNNYRPEYKGINKEVLNHFTQLDDTDILSAAKVWQNHKDIVLSKLSKCLTERLLPKAELCETREQALEIAEHWKNQIANSWNITKEDANWFVKVHSVKQKTYSTTSHGINLLYKDKITDISKVSELITHDRFKDHDQKHYVLHPKDLC